MNKALQRFVPPPSPGEKGFGLVEFLLSTVILLALSAGVFTTMADIQRTASYQTEVQTVLSNTRIAVDTIHRYLSQAGNNPRNAAFEAVTVISPTEIRVRSDLRGSDVTDPDKGDPDGDINDLDEDITIRFNTAQRALQIVTPVGGTHRVAEYITGCTMQCYDAAGALTTNGAQVRKIRITVTGNTTLSDPKTKKTFGVSLSSDVQIANRQ